MSEEGGWESLMTLLRGIADTRIDQYRRHPLQTILCTALVSMLCGADSFSEIVDVAEANREWLEKHIELPNGISSHGTFCRVFSIIDRDKFCEAFAIWTQTLLKGDPDKSIAIDGKALCGSLAILRKWPIWLHAWSVESGVCVGQQAVQSKSSELKAMEPLLRLLDLKGCTVTADALHSHVKTAALIIEKGGDYALPIRKNQKNFKEEVECLFTEAFKQDFKGIDAEAYETIEKNMVA